MSILVCGGAGYIGSHTVAELVEQGKDVVVIDNLQKGHKESVWSNAQLCIGDIRNNEFMNKIFNENNIESVIHFAADSLVGESVENPIKYYENNVYTTMCLLKKMNEYNVKKIVFSSTAAVYGNPKNIPIKEDDETIPTNPYGETKLAIEKMLKWADKAYDIKYIALRYFNAAGAHISGKIGEAHNPETHLIPLVLQTVLGQREKMMIYGNDYNTPDGTCVRDYIHVTDLANAHILALESLARTQQSNIYNLGNGKGFSVKEVIDAVEKVTGKNVNKEISERRAGDPDILIASSEKAKKELGWIPKYNKLEDIILTAYNYIKLINNGGVNYET